MKLFNILFVFVPAAVIVFPLIPNEGAWVTGVAVGMTCMSVSIAIAKINGE